MRFEDLPAINASLNGLSGILLVFGYRAIRQGRKQEHKAFMVAALVVSVAFLTCYVIYHAGMQRVHGDPHTRFLKPAWFRPWYLAFLFTHLIAAAINLPMAIITVRFALKGGLERHKRLARITWPLWMYVSVTGVLIYLLLYHVFPQR